MSKIVYSLSKKFEVLEQSSTYKTMINRVLKLQDHIGLLTQDIKTLIEPNISFISKIDYNLIYSSSIDGDSACAFHTHCNNCEPTLTIIKTTKDIIIGRYTSITWDPSCLSIKNDKKNFLFSLTKNDYYSIDCNPSYVPSFSNGILNISDNFFTQYSYEMPNQSNKLINNNTGGFLVKELDVYQVIITNEPLNTTKQVLLSLKYLKSLCSLKRITISTIVIMLIGYILKKLLK